MIDIDKYLNSGVVEEYYLGILSDDQIHQLLGLREKYPKVKGYMEEAAKLDFTTFSCSSHSLGKHLP